MDDDKFNMSLRRFLKQVGIRSQKEIERLVRERSLRGTGVLKVKIVLTAQDSDLKSVLEGEIDLGEEDTES